jgi:hypothetical protein
VIHVESGDDTVILEGKVKEVIDRVVLEQVSKAYVAKYSGNEVSVEPDPKVVWLALEPEVVYAWQEKNFVKSATRWRFHS